MRYNVEAADELVENVARFMLDAVHPVVGKFDLRPIFGDANYLTADLTLFVDHLAHYVTRGAPSILTLSIRTPALREVCGGGRYLLLMPEAVLDVTGDRAAVVDAVSNMRLFEIKPDSVARFSTELWPPDLVGQFHDALWQELQRVSEETRFIYTWQSLLPVLDAMLSQINPPDHSPNDVDSSCYRHIERIRHTIGAQPRSCHEAALVRAYDIVNLLGWLATLTAPFTECMATTLPQQLQTATDTAHEQTEAPQ